MLRNQQSHKYINTRPTTHPFPRHISQQPSLHYSPAHSLSLHPPSWENDNVHHHRSIILGLVSKAGTEFKSAPQPAHSLSMCISCSSSSSMTLCSGPLQLARPYDDQPRWATTLWLAPETPRPLCPVSLTFAMALPPLNQQKLLHWDNPSS